MAITRRARRGAPLVQRVMNGVTPIGECWIWQGRIDAWHAADERGEAGQRVTHGLAAVLAALADTSAQALGPDPAQARIDSIAADRAQARHTDGDATGGGEHGS